MNNVMLLGNLATGVELKNIAGDRQVGRFLLAVSRYGKKGTDFVRVVTWNKSAANAAKYLDKGSKVCIVGRLSSEFYERKVDKKAETRLTTEVVAETIEYLSAPRRAGSPPIAAGAPGLRPATPASK